MRVAKAFAPILNAAGGGGALVDIHSVLSWIGGFGAYGATKAAVEKGEPEVLADDISRHFKSALSGPVSGLAPLL